MRVFQPHMPATTHQLGSRGVAALDVLPTNFNALIWNIHKASHPRLGSHLDHLSSLSDLVLLQEAIECQTPAAHAWQFARGFQSQDSFAGVAIGSQARAVMSEAIRSVAREPLLDTPKMALATKYQLEDRPNPLLVVNVHAINFASDGAFRSQLAQVHDSMSEHIGPVLFAGDFNTWSPSRTRALNELAATLKLTPVPISNDSRRLVLDHAFVRDLEVTSATLFDDVKSSDHAPLFLRLKA